MPITTDPPNLEPQPGSSQPASQRVLADELIIAAASIVEAVDGLTGAVRDLDRNIHKLRDLIATKVRQR